MIIQASERSWATKLAIHLTNADDNERVVVRSSRHVITGDDVFGALKDMEAIARDNRCIKHMHHVMMNPSASVTDEQWDRCWELYEQEYGLENQPYIEVEHHKKGRTHRHRVYHRIRRDAPAIEFSNSYPRNEKVARILEHEFGHELTIGKHNRAVIARLREDGFDLVADWMEQGRAHEAERPVADRSKMDDQIEKRTGLSKAAMEQVIRAAWDQSDSGRSLRSALGAEGLILARGDKAGYHVIVDQAGAPHPLNRRLGEKVAVVRERMADLDPADLPSVAEARAEQLELMRRHEQALAERVREEEAKDHVDDLPEPEADRQNTPQEAAEEPPEDDQTSGQPQAPDTPSDTPPEPSRQDQEDHARRHQEELERRRRRREAELRRRQQLAERQKREEQRRRAAEKAEAIKAQLEDQPEDRPSLLARANSVLFRAVRDKVVGWVRQGIGRLFGRSPDVPQPPQQDREPEKQAGAAVEIPQKSERQRPPDRGKEGSDDWGDEKYEIVDLDDPDYDPGNRPERGIRTGRSRRDRDRGREDDRDRDD